MPIIVLTSGTIGASFEQTKNLASNNCMNKPILENVLLIKILLHLKKDLRKTG